jgi:hypothetical protein
MTSGEVDLRSQLKPSRWVRFRHSKHTLRLHYAHTATKPDTYTVMRQVLVVLGTHITCGGTLASTHGFHDILV